MESYVERFAREQKEKAESGRREPKTQKPVKKVKNNPEEVKEDGKRDRS